MASKRSKRIGCGILVLGTVGALSAGYYFVLIPMSEWALLASCRPYVIYRVSESYAREFDGGYPPLSPIYGRFTYDTDAEGIRVRWITDHICEADPDRSIRDSIPETNGKNYIDDWSYVYLGYFIENEEQGLAFISAYQAVVDENGTFEDDLVVPEGSGNGGSKLLHRLRSPSTLPEELDYLGRKLDQIPIVIEWPDNHGKRGPNTANLANVVYLDGHTEVLDYPGKFPMTEKFITALRALDEKAGPYNPD